MKLFATCRSRSRTALFMLRNGLRMLAHPFRGSTLTSLLGLEDQRKTSAYHRALRQAEREHLSPLGECSSRELSEILPALLAIPLTLLFS